MSLHEFLGITEDRGQFILDNVIKQAVEFNSVNLVLESMLRLCKSSKEIILAGYLVGYYSDSNYKDSNYKK